MIFKHTPLPWRLEMRRDVWGVIGAGELPICTFPATAPELADEQIANMNLVKAAPVLLHALVALHRICRDCDLEHEAERPTEEQYTAAMDAAEEALAAIGTNVGVERPASSDDGNADTP